MRGVPVATRARATHATARTRAYTIDMSFTVATTTTRAMRATKPRAPRANATAASRGTNARRVVARATTREGDAKTRREALKTSIGFLAGALATVALDARAKGDDEDKSYAGKLSARDARRAEILAAARAKAQAQAASPVPASDDPKNADMFMTEDPGRGGGPDAPNTAQ